MWVRKTYFYFTFFFLSMLIVRSTAAFGSYQNLENELEVKRFASLVDDCDLAIHVIDFKYVLNWLTRKSVVEDFESNFLEPLRSVPELNESATTLDCTGPFLQTIESLHLFVRSNKANQFDYLVTCRVKDLDDSVANDFVSFMKQAVSRLADKEGNVLTYPAESMLEFRLVDDFLVLGNNQEWVAQAHDSYNAPLQVKGTLAGDRRFLRSLASSPNRDYSVFCYFNPALFKSWFHINLPSKALKLESLGGGSFFGWIDDASALVGTGNIFNTFPAKGIPEAWDAFEPLPEFPCLDLEIIEFYAQAWEPDTLYDLTKRKFEEVHGPDTFETWREKVKRTNSSLDPYVLIHGANQRYSVRYESTSGNPKSMSIANRNGAQISKDETIDRLLSALSEEGVKKLAHVDDAIFLGYPPELVEAQYKDQLGRFEKQDRYLDVFLTVSKDRYQRFKIGNSTLDEEEAKREFSKILAREMVDNDGYIISDEWLLSGQLQDIQVQYICLKESRECSTAKIKQLREEAESLTANSDGPFRFNYNRAHFNRPAIELRKTLRNLFEFRLPDSSAAVSTIEEKDSLPVVSSLALTSALQSVETSFSEATFALFKKESLEYFFKLSGK